MATAGRGWICGAMLVAALIFPGRSAARACIGDCDRDGQVSVTELITGVRISLGEAPLSDCPAFDANPDGLVDIEELVRAVAAALSGCPATPAPDTATPTGSDTATATGADTPIPTDTPTATGPPSSTGTPTVPIVSGRWREDPLAVTASTCVALVTQQFAADLAARPPCEQTVDASSPTAATLIDCTGTRIDGALDRDGALHFAYPTESTTTNDCTVALTAAAVIPAAVSPTTATYTFAVDFSGTCPLTACMIAAQGTWTRE